MNKELLISLVENYPELYNVGHAKYHEDQRRTEIWKEIATAMKQTPSQCKEKWTNIRDNYRKAINLRKSKAANSIRKMKPIRFGKELSFLNVYLNNESQQSPSPVAATTDDELSSGAGAGGGGGGSSPPPDPRPPDTWISSPKRIKLEEIPTTTHSVYPSFEASYLMPEPSRQESDTLIDFFKNLGQTVKRFPLDLQVRVKSEVFNVVNQAESEFVQRLKCGDSSTF